MAGERSRSLRIYIRRRKAQIRREQGGNADAAIAAFLRQFGRSEAARAARRGADSPEGGSKQ
jgi:hypothetical protein